MDPHFSLEANHGHPPFSGTDFPGVFENQAEENHACLKKIMPVLDCDSKTCLSQFAQRSTQFIWGYPMQMVRETI